MLYLIFIIVIILSLFSYTPIHELGHTVTIIFLGTLHRYKLSDINIHIKFSSILKGKTHCNYHLFSIVEIKIIALFGDMFCMLYSLILGLIIYSSLIKDWFYITVIMISLVLPCFCLLVFLYSWLPKPKKDNDKYIFLYPSEFLANYTYPN